MQIHVIADTFKASAVLNSTSLNSHFS